MTVYDLAAVVRSKNAGPFVLTIDLLFASHGDYARVLNSPRFAPHTLAAAYGCRPEEVAIHPFEAVLAIKVTVPRRQSSGCPADRDVYGSQQHGAVGAIELNEE